MQHLSNVTNIKKLKKTDRDTSVERNGQQCWRQFIFNINETPRSRAQEQDDVGEAERDGVFSDTLHTNEKKSKKNRVGYKRSELNALGSRLGGLTRTCHKIFKKHNYPQQKSHHNPESTIQPLILQQAPTLSAWLVRNKDGRLTGCCTFQGYLILQLKTCRLIITACLIHTYGLVRAFV